jgi:hypothetical protein
VKPFRLLILFLLIAACTPTARATGAIEGHITIGPLVPVVREGEAEPTPAPEVYAAYPLVIYEQDGKTEVERVTADADGNYRVVLPAGTYVVDTIRQGVGGAGKLPREVNVVAGQVTRLDVDIDTGIR